MHILHLICTLFLLGSGWLQAQSLTVGTINYTSDVEDGYILFSPLSANDVYLVDNCGRRVNEWNNSPYVPGASVYLLEDGSLLKTARLINPNINIGGIGGRVERWSWDDSLMWAMNFSGTDYVQHHDIQPLPNGNVLILGLEVINGFTAQSDGRDPMLIHNNEVWSEFIWEVEPVGPDSGVVVWEWHAWDHLIQDFDMNQDNFGVVSEHPELIDLNYVTEENTSDWLHANAVAYNEELDQIALSMAHFDEFWLIDHSTSTQEAAGHTGGIRGKGGDLLYRWGNPRTYQRGDTTDQKLFFQHDIHWIPAGMPDAGKMIVFNNGVGRAYSSVEILDLPQTAPGEYVLNAGQAYGPASPHWIHTAANPTDLFSKLMSGAQQLPNGNVLICVANNGHFIEVDSNSTTVWEYINPATATGTTAQFSVPPGGANSVFRTRRYTPDFPGFVGRNLAPGLPVEFPFDTQSCVSQLTNQPEPATTSSFQIFPNPAHSILHLQTSDPKIHTISIQNLLGKTVYEGKFSRSTTISVENWAAGMYWIRLDQNRPQVIVVDSAKP
ncbi:MAG: aryl-sulfate sulfotransferase [Bacteroidota bacterium]